MPTAAFDAFDRMLAQLVKSGLPPAEDAFADWLDMATRMEAVVSTDGRSHLPTLISADVRLDHPGSPPAARGLAALDALVQASLAAGWQGQDADRVLAAALDRACVAALDRVLALPGLPPRDQWCNIQAHVLNAYGNRNRQAAPLPAPCAWASVNALSNAPALEWWLAQRLPMPPRILDHASPATLEALLAAGAAPDGQTVAAWRARCSNARHRAAQPLSEADIGTMADCLQKAARLSGESAMEARRTPGRALLERLASRPVSPADLGAALEAWRETCPNQALPGFPSGKAWLFRRVKGSVPWWSHALVGCLNQRGQGRNINAIFGAWQQAAGATAQFDPRLPKPAQDLLCGFALLATWMCAANSIHAGNDLSHTHITRQGCVDAAALFLRTAAWAGLDVVSAWQCTAKAVAESFRLGAGLSDIATDRIRVAMSAMLIVATDPGNLFFESPLATGVLEVLASSKPGVLPEGSFIRTHVVLSKEMLPTDMAMRLGFMVLANATESMFAPPVPSAIACDAAQSAQGLVSWLRQRIEDGDCIDPATLPALPDAQPVVAALLRHNAVAFGHRAAPLGHRPRRHA